MKKLLYVITFFLLIWGALYIIKSLNPKDGVEFKDIKNAISSITNGIKDNTTLDDEDLKNIKKLGSEGQKKLLDVFEGKDLFKDKKIKDFLTIEKYLGKDVKDKFYKIAYDTFTKNPSKFIKESIGIDNIDLGNIFKAFMDKYIEKPKLIENIEDIIKNNELSSDEKDKAEKLLNELK